MYFVFDRPDLLVVNFHLYSGGKKWSQLLLYVSEGGQLSQVLQNSSDAVVAVFKAT